MARDAGHTESTAKIGWIYRAQPLVLYTDIRTGRLAEKHTYTQREPFELSFLVPTCSECIAWCGCCRNGKRPTIAQDPACDDFQAKGE